MSNTVFPGSLDTFTNPTATSSRNSPSLSAQQGVQNDAIAAIEAKVGVDSSAVTTSLSYKLSAITGSDKASSLAASLSGWYSVSDAWVYASADSPTFVITVPTDATTTYTPGMRVRLTQTTVKYFLVTAVTATTLTVYGGTDYTLANAAISAISVSGSTAPFGFPLDPAKWSVTLTDTSNRNQASPGAGTWYNPGSLSITIPIGIWLVQKGGSVGIVQSGGAQGTASFTLSTTNSTESDSTFTTTGYVSVLSAESFVPHFIMKPLTLATKTQYFLNIRASAAITTVELRGDQQATVVRATSSYL